MSPEQRDELMSLYLTARNAWGEAERDGKKWPAAYAADEAFTRALNAA